VRRLPELLQGVRKSGEVWLALLACALLAATFAHPSLRVSRDVYRYVVVFDITQSMNALDYELDGRPASRLEFAKAAMHRALRELPCGSQMGFALFTAHRSLLLFEPVEICANYREILATIDRVDWRMGWAGESEIAKGLHSGLRIAAELEPKPALVFVTDGHEAPPVNPYYRPQFDDRPGTVKGVIVGTGGLLPVPIPKRDMEGNSLGYWKAEDVMQSDRYSAGRPSSVPGEQVVEADGSPVVGFRSTGHEHLSSLHEAYLQELAHGLELSYYGLSSVEGLGDAMRRPGFARATVVDTDMRWLPAAAALAALLLLYPPRLRARDPSPESRRHAT
jgi:mxaL protein